MGATVRAFFTGGFTSFGSAVRWIRTQHPSETLELVSDVRERWACRLVNAPRNLWPYWQPGHPFRRHIRMGRVKRSGLVTIPAAVSNLYAAYELVLTALVGPGHRPFSPAPAWPALRGSVPGRGRLRIGIHPFASAPCKLWPRQHWVVLLESLRSQFPDASVVLFGSPADRGELDALAGAAHGPPEIFTASLREFKLRLRDLDLLIGLDSVAVHLAHSQGVPAIVLVGPNDPRLFTPPGARAATHTGGCVHQPCGGKPRCIGTGFQYVCMNSISPGQVLERIDAPPTL
jgi:heptosyltransferase-3